MDGLLRVGERIANGSFQPDVKHPMILPKSHHVVTLIIRHYHHFSGHSGVEHVLSLLREKFWVVGARAAVRKSLGVCVIAKDDRPELAKRRWRINLRTELNQINLLSPMWALIASVHS